MSTVREIIEGSALSEAEHWQNNPGDLKALERAVNEALKKIMQTMQAEGEVATRIASVPPRPYGKLDTGDDSYEIEIAGLIYPRALKGFSEHELRMFDDAFVNAVQAPGRVASLIPQMYRERGSFVVVLTLDPADMGR